MPHQSGYFLYALVAIVLIIIASIFFLDGKHKINLENKSKHIIYNFNI